MFWHSGDNFLSISDKKLKLAAHEYTPISVLWYPFIINNFNFWRWCKENITQVASNGFQSTGLLTKRKFSYMLLDSGDQYLWNACFHLQQIPVWSCELPQCREWGDSPGCIMGIAASQRGYASSGMIAWQYMY